MNSTSHKINWIELADHFDQLSKLSIEQRSTYLEQLSLKQPVLKNKLEQLLSESPTFDKFMETPALTLVAGFLPNALALPTLEPGEKIDDYVIERKLGQGGVAAVYLSKQISLDRLVAIKVCPNEGNEARTIAQLEHDHIVSVYSETRIAANHVRYISMQYIAGLNFEELLAQLNSPSISGQSVLEILEKSSSGNDVFRPSDLKFRDQISKMTYLEVCFWWSAKLLGAINFAHHKNILHLDIKPSNILINLYGRPFLSDFNVSQLGSNLQRGTSECFGGTTGYMAPEQAAVFTETDKSIALSKLDSRADVYSFGRVFKDMIAKAPQSSNSPGYLTLLNYANIIGEKASQHDPSLRFSSIKEFQLAIEGLGDLSSSFRKFPALSPALRWAAKHPLLAITFFGAIPQLIATVYGTGYNLVQIIQRLSLNQQLAFDRFNLMYTPTISAISVALWLWVLLRLKPFLVNPKDYINDVEQITKWRQHALRLPYWGVLISTLGWVPGAVLFPVVLSREGDLPALIHTHLIVSFAVSYLISLSYSLLIHQLVVLQFIYPRFWLGEHHIPSRADSELRTVPKLARIAAICTGMIPLIGAILLVFMGPNDFSPTQYQGFRTLVSLLIGFGITGVFLALSLSTRINRLHAAMTEPKA